MRSTLNPETLPRAIAQLVNDPDETFGLSIFSLWEAAKKHQQGKRPLPMELAPWLKAAIPSHVRLLPLTNDIIIDATRLPEFLINDPADELIVATARVHKLTLLTTDTKKR